MTENRIPAAFREAFRNHPAGVAVLTAQSPSGPVAMTVSSLISISASPPIVGFSLSGKSGSSASILAAETIVIHMLRRSDVPLAVMGATPGAERFGQNVEWEYLASGEPRYTSVATWFRARLCCTLPLGSATLVAAELLDGEVHAGSDTSIAEALIYLDRGWHKLQEEVGGVRRVTSMVGAINDYWI